MTDNTAPTETDRDEDLWIEPREIAMEVADTPPCPDCISSYMVRVYRNDEGYLDWQIGTAHNPTCPDVARRHQLPPRAR